MKDRQYDTLAFHASSVRMDAVERLHSFQRVFDGATREDQLKLAAIDKKLKAYGYRYLSLGDSQGEWENMRAAASMFSQWDLMKNEN